MTSLMAINEEKLLNFIRYYKVRDREFDSLKSQISK